MDKPTKSNTSYDSRSAPVGCVVSPLKCVKPTCATCAYHERKSFSWCNFHNRQTSLKWTCEEHSKIKEKNDEKD